MESSPNFCKIVSIPKKPDLTLEILPIKSSDISKISEITSKIFHDHEPITKALKCNLETILNQDHIPTLEKSIEEGMALVAYDKSNGNFVSTIWAEDQTTMPQDEDDDDSLDDRIKELFSFLELVEERALPLLPKPSKKYESLHVMIVALNQEYKGLDITSEMMKFFMYEHPIGKKSKRFFTQASNVRSRKMFEKCGWKTIFEFPYSEVKDDERFKRIKEIDVSLGEQVHFMVWERPTDEI